MTSYLIGPVPVVLRLAPVDGVTDDVIGTQRWKPGDLKKSLGKGYLGK